MTASSTGGDEIMPLLVPRITHAAYKLHQDFKREISLLVGNAMSQITNCDC